MLERVKYGSNDILFGGQGKKNILEKGENAGIQHFLLFPKYFQNLSNVFYCLGFYAEDLNISVTEFIL